MSRVRHLTAHEQEVYDVVDKKLAAKVLVIDIPMIPGGYSGMTLGRFICLADPQPTTGTSTLLAHELVHVQQFYEQGPLRFLWTYLRAFFGGLRTHRGWNQAYRNIPQEVEARSAANHWAQRQNRD